jgi:hypothetical protein
VLGVARVMIEAEELASRFCTMPIAEIAERASCSMKSVTKARAVLSKSGLWIAGPGGVFVPVALNGNQVAENKWRKSGKRLSGDSRPREPYDNVCQLRQDVSSTSTRI